MRATKLRAEGAIYLLFTIALRSCGRLVVLAGLGESSDMVYAVRLLDADRVGDRALAVPDHALGLVVALAHATSGAVEQSPTSVCATGAEAERYLSIVDLLCGVVPVAVSSG
jgi:hypothetical protein